MRSNPFIEDLKNQYHNGSTLIKLIFVNVGIFLAVNLVGLMLWLFNVNNGSSIIIKWFALPASFSNIIIKPWTLISYMFLHEQFFHVFINMFILYFGGQIFMQFLNAKQLLTTYFLGGLAGGLLYILAFNLFPVFNELVPYSVALGASASVMAILIAVATYVPNYVVRLLLFGEVKLKYIAIFYFILDIVSISQSNSGGHIAHIGGALFGFFYIQQLKKGKDVAVGFNRMLMVLGSFFKPRKKMKVVYRNQRKSKSDYDYNAQKKVNQEQIDAILDKISRSGYDSLTAEEKAILFDASKN